jgi:hypothetical protein
MEIPVKEHKSLADGVHKGVIKSVVFREHPLRYTDYCIETEGINIKASYPTNITPETIHGRMLQRFGVLVVPGKSINPEQLVNRECSFFVRNNVTPKGTFPEILRDTLKPYSLQPTQEVVK